MSIPFEVSTCLFRPLNYELSLEPRAKTSGFEPIIFPITILASVNMHRAGNDSDFWAACIELSRRNLAL